MPEFYEHWTTGSLKDYYYDKVVPLAHAFQTEAMSWLKGDGGDVLEAMFRRYV